MHRLGACAEELTIESPAIGRFPLLERARRALKEYPVRARTALSHIRIELGIQTLSEHGVIGGGSARFSKNTAENLNGAEGLSPEELGPFIKTESLAVRTRA